MECGHNLVNHLGKFLLPAKDNVRLLHVGDEAELGEYLVFRGVVVSPCFVAPGSPAVVPAAHRAVSDGDHVLDRADYHTFAPGIRTATLRDDARNRPRVRLDLRTACNRLIFYHKMLLPVFLYQVRVGYEHRL